MAPDGSSASRAARRRGTREVLGLALAAAVAAGLGACGGEPLHPSKWKEPPDEIPQGDGLLTGEEGEWKVYRSN